MPNTPEEPPCARIDICGFGKQRREVCVKPGKVKDNRDFPCYGSKMQPQVIDRSSEGPQIAPKNENGELSLEQLRTRQQKLQEAVDNRVDEKGERVTKGVPPCEDALGRPVDRFGRHLR